MPPPKTSRVPDGDGARRPAPNGRGFQGHGASLYQFRARAAGGFLRGASSDRASTDELSTRWFIVCFRASQSSYEVISATSRDNSATWNCQRPVREVPQ